MEKIVLGYPKLKERIDSRENSKSEKEKALKNLKEIAADYSPRYMKTFERFLDATLSKLYDGIHFEDGEGNFRKLVENHSVVLVPNHQSHADYLVINYVFFKNFKMPLYVAGGINLNIFPIGKLFRKSGCFFIRRSFASDITYKLTFEAYLYYLLKEKKPVEFFFEGGRSRTGKLRPPRFGLYSMLLDAHTVLLEEDPGRELVFIPTTIIHEYVPETKSLAKELGGGKKVAESAGQVFGLVKLFASQFGNVHIRFGKEVMVPKYNEETKKKITQDLAFKCFREVGKNMMVTPSSLLAMVLLDEPAGALNWNDILCRVRAIMDYCTAHDVPSTKSLIGDSLEPTLERTIDIFIANKKVEVIGRHHHGQKFYTIREDCRQELMYFKNTILHHFIVPNIIVAGWIHLFRGQLNDVNDLKRFFLTQRNQLKHEFYLPTVKEFFHKSLTVLSDAVGRELATLEDMMELNQKEIYAIISKVGVFGRSLSYITEGYYISALALNELMKQSPQGFKMGDFNKKAQEIFQHELSLQRIIRFGESYSVPLTRNAVQYFSQLGMVENESGVLKITKQKDFDSLIDTYEKDLVDQTTFNIRAQMC